MSTHLTWSAYLDHIRTESARFADVIATCDPVAPVASCPGWTASDLLSHLTRVQHWWAHVLQIRPAAPDGYVELEAPADFAARLGLFTHWSGRFQDVIATCDPTEPAWSWSSQPGDHTVGFTYRRQAHESLIHRLDAELMAGEVTALPADLASDGVDEALDLMLGGLPAWGSWQPLDHYVRVDLTDTDTSIWSRLGIFSGTSPDGTVYAGDPDQHRVQDPGTEPDAVVQGTADNIDAWLWRRRDDSDITITGDREVYDRWRIAVDQPIT